MPVVFDNLELPGSAYDVLARVDVYLVADDDDPTAPGVITGSDLTILDKQSGYSNGAGYVSFNLRANPLIEPANTYYVWETHFKDGRVNRRTISVPNGAGPYHVADIMITPAADMFPGAESAWTDYTPTWTTSGTAPTLGNGTLVGAYKLIGKTLFFRTRLQFGSTSDKGTGQFFFALPTGLQAKAGVEQPFTGKAYDSSSGNNYVLAGFVIGLATRIEAISNGASSVGGTSPFTWAVGDGIEFAGVIEVE